MFGCGGSFGGCGGCSAGGSCGGGGAFGGVGAFGGKGGGKPFGGPKGFGKGPPGKGKGGFEDEDRSRDWYCPQCRERNFVKRGSCYKCQTAKPPDSELQAARPPAPPPSGTTLNGMVKSFNRKGFGFLMVMGSDYGQDVYYTREQLSPKLQTRDIPGQHVTFELMRYSDGKLSAHNIRPLGDDKDEAWGKGPRGGFGLAMPGKGGDDDRSRDWICTRCNERNFVKRLECFKCNVPRMGVGVGAGLSSPSAPPPPPRRTLSPHAGSRAVRDQLAGAMAAGRSGTRSRSRRRESSSGSSSSSSDEHARKREKQRKRKKKRQRSSSSSSSSASKSSDCKMDESSAAGQTSKAASNSPEAEKAKSEALEELMRLRSVEPKEVRMSEWRALLRKWHPDKNPDRIEVATEVFQFLQKGKAILDGASGTAATR
eukprot:SRR837773.15219.p1 GENE.SRR837773.15219~~SRR837773.15219.p1  ORF type:complete len:426 (-),score=40.60 SRR837773.15219:16-1293(-)